MMETIKAIIFDMDGVIFDSETMYINDLIRFFKQHDIEIQVNDCIPLIGIDSKFNIAIVPSLNNMLSSIK